MKRLHSTLLAQAALTLALHAHGASTPIGEPYYGWTLYEWKELNPTPGQFRFIRESARSGDQYGGTLLAEHNMGGSLLGFPALDMVAAYNDGRTFWSQTLSPTRGGAARDVVGGASEIFVSQSYIKDSVDARLDFSFTAGRLQLVEYGSGRGDGFDLAATARFNVSVVNHSTGLETWSENQSVSLFQAFADYSDRFDNYWDIEVTQRNGPLHMSPWQWTCDACGNPAYGFVTANLDGPYTGSIGLSYIPVGGEFTVGFYLITAAVDERQGETSALAYAKDPVSADGAGVGFEFSGLTPTNRPILLAPVPEPATWGLMGCGLACIGSLARRRAEAARTAS